MDNRYVKNATDAETSFAYIEDPNKHFSDYVDGLKVSEIDDNIKRSTLPEYLQKVLNGLKNF